MPLPGFPFRGRRLPAQPSTYDECRLEPDVSVEIPAKQSGFMTPCKAFVACYSRPH